jgi:hypothetical protein
MPLTSDSCGESLKLRADPLALSVHQDHLGGQGTARQLITLPLQLAAIHGSAGDYASKRQRERQSRANTWIHSLSHQRAHSGHQALHLKPGGQGVALMLNHTRVTDGARSGLGRQGIPTP